MKNTLLTLVTYNLLFSSSSQPAFVNAHLVWWDPFSWIEEACILSFKVIMMPFRHWSYANRFKRLVKAEFDLNTSILTDAVNNG